MKKLSICLLFVLLLLTACGSSSVTTYDTASTEEIMSDSFGINGDIELTKSDSDRKVIVTGDLSIDTTNIKNVVEKINEQITKYEAYVISSSESNYDNNQNVNLTIRIPAEKFNDFINDLKNENNVTYLNIYSDDITDTYVDNNARLNNLKAQESRLLELLEEAKDISDVIAIESELTNVRSDIEYYETTIENYDKQIEYSTLYINISSCVADTSYSFVSRIKDAFSSTFNSFVNVLKDIIIFLIYAIPYIVVITVVVIIIIKIMKTRK